MKKIFITLIALIFSGVAINAKNYSHKAVRPAASDHTWSDYDYNFTLNEEGDLVGTNTFSRVYNQTPPSWKNSGYYGEGIRMYTGHETLTITVLPGFMNYKYTLTTAIIEWQWDTHLLKWVKKRNMPTNGTRTFTTKDGVVNGAFEIPVVVSAFGPIFVCGNSVNGVIPSGQKLSWKIYDYSESAPQTGTVITSDGSDQRISVITYLEDVDKQDLSGSTGLGRFGWSELGSYVMLAFPYIRGQYQGSILTDIANITHVGSSLEKYAEIVLPEVYYDKYVDPYAPVTEVLPNGHTRISTLQQNHKKYYVETWSDNGYDYESRYDEDGLHPTIGTKTVSDTTFIHASDDGWSERGFKVKNRYYMTSLHKGSSDYFLDWSNFKKEGIGILDENKSKYWFTLNSDEYKPSFTGMDISSSYTDDTYKLYIIKAMDSDGKVTVSSDYTSELSPQAKEFIDFANHPYIQKEYQSKITIEKVTMDSNGNVVLPTGRNIPYDKKEYFDYCHRMLRLSRQPNNPLKELQSLIGMELDVPDYDVEKFDAKVIGKRTAKLIKDLPDWLNAKLHNGEIKLDDKGRPYQDIWPNGAKRAFLKDNRFNDFKKATVTRLVKTGKRISVFVTTIGYEGEVKVTELVLEDNLPMDEYTNVWRVVAKNTK